MRGEAGIRPGGSFTTQTAAVQSGRTKNTVIFVLFMSHTECFMTGTQPSGERDASHPLRKAVVLAGSRTCGKAGLRLSPVDGSKTTLSLPALRFPASAGADIFEIPMILARIESLLPELRPSERRVAEIVLARPTLTAGASIRMIAAAAEASEPTVMRFCRAIGCAGVQDLKRQIARDLGRFTPARFAEATPAIPAAFLGQQVLDHAFETLFEMRKRLPDAGYDRAATLMGNASRLSFWGPGGHGDLARDAASACVRLGGTAEAAWDEAMFDREARSASAGLTIVALDVPCTRDGTHIPVPAMQRAKSAGARLVVLGFDPDPRMAAALHAPVAASLADCCVPVVGHGAPDWLGPRLALHILLEGWKFEHARAGLARRDV